MEPIDDEYAEYITRAKTRDTLAKLAKEKNSTPKTSTAGASTPVQSDDPDNPIITVMIRSRLNTTTPIPPMQAKMRFYQQIRLVRRSFISYACQKHRLELDEAEFDDIVLTWCGNRIYDYTTPMSLSARPDDTGRYTSRGSGRLLSREPKGFERGGLIFEAWHIHAYELFVKEKERSHQRALVGGGGEGDEDSDEDAMFVDQENGAGAGVKDEPKPRKIRLTLKPKNLEPLNMTAHPDTKVAILVEAFRTQREVAPTTKVALYWDGERLDEETPLEETEVEDEDTIEVHLN